MEDVVLRVRPAASGWLVEARDLEPLMFLSGAKAEAQAHALARCMAGAGNDAEVVVHDRTEKIVGAARYFARIYNSRRHALA
ncbi:MAG TPA: hypothetical protein VF474_06195 [Phenylobacterium sp.]